MTFLTEAKGSPRDAKKLLELLKSENFNPETWSALESSSIVEGTAPSTNREILNSKTGHGMASNRKAYRNQRRSTSMYHNIPTQNIKYEKFIETLMNSDLEKSEISEEIILYN